MKSYIDFYEANKIIPVNQEITKDHYKRRTHLYRQLGCPPLTFRGSNILEIGPGTGDNAVVTGSFKPATYELWDGNSKSIEAIQTKIDEGQITNATARQIDIYSEEFLKDNKTFDIVICEGASAQSDPKEFYKRVLSKVNKKRGIGICTCTSALSATSELIRKIWYLPLREKELKEAAYEGAQVFKPHLDTLRGVSRSAEDWVLDTILNPIPRGFSIDPAELIALAQKNELGLLGASSPDFKTDYVWYKEITMEHKQDDYTQRMISNWNKQKLSVLDNRLQLEDIYAATLKDKQICQDIESLSSSLGIVVSEIYQEPSNIQKHESFKDVIKGMIERMESIEELHATRKSLDDFYSVMPRIIDGDIHTDTKSFKCFWGRGQQYLSLVSDKNLN